MQLDTRSRPFRALMGTYQRLKSSFVTILLLLRSLLLKKVASVCSDCLSRLDQLYYFSSNAICLADALSMLAS